jgi:hypothetical protein
MEANQSSTEHLLELARRTRPWSYRSQIQKIVIFSYLCFIHSLEISYPPEILKQSPKSPNFLLKVIFCFVKVEDYPVINEIVLFLLTQACHFSFGSILTPL